MMSNNWERVRLGDVIEINPKESIKKGDIAKKIAMEKLEPFTKFIDKYDSEEFKGGTKFRNGDTLVARITPCLENGKTSQVTILDENEVGFGSTEFIVFREKEGITNRDYIYYFSISPYFRDIAIKSMVGSSGRQRVQIKSIEELEFNLPPLETQEKIANILSSLDDKIENNKKTAEKLEEIAQTLFNRWFVEFNFPDENGLSYKDNGGEMVESELGLIPKGWEVGKIEDIIEYFIGGDWGNARETEEFTQPILCLRGADFPKSMFGELSDVPLRYVKKSNLIKRELIHGDIVFEISGGTKGRPVGRSIYIDNNILKEYEYSVSYSNFCRLIRSRKGYDKFLYLLLQHFYEDGTIEKYQMQSTGISNFQFANFKDKQELIIPAKDRLTCFNEIVSVLYSKKYSLQTHKLQNLRDMLLSKLMSGEMEV